MLREYQPSNPSRDNPKSGTDSCKELTTFLQMDQSCQHLKETKVLE